jgi:hypothetical protein
MQGLLQNTILASLNWILNSPLGPEGRWRYVEMPGNQDTYVTHMKANQPPKGIMERNFITQMRRLHGLSDDNQCKKAAPSPFTG